MVQSTEPVEIGAVAGLGGTQEEDVTGGLAAGTPC